uniref:Uncharacterized protein n=1 Tax=Arundo donax TaxID=35708 RepID=A0A0A9CST0_ARUDO
MTYEKTTLLRYWREQNVVDDRSAPAVGDQRRIYMFLKFSYFILLLDRYGTLSSDSGQS